MLWLSSLNTLDASANIKTVGEEQQLDLFHLACILRHKQQTNNQTQMTEWTDTLQIYPQLNIFL